VVRVVSIWQTCNSSPSQWQGSTSLGRSVYVRYRWGHLQIGVGRTFKLAVRNSSSEPLLLKKVGGPWDGLLTYQRLRRFGRGKIAWPAHCKDEWVR
jgi:hypothetical protein